MIGVAIVGMGYGAAGHLPAWRAQPGARVMGICGARSELSRTRAEELGVPYLDWEEMLTDQGIHVLSLCVPPAAQPALIAEAAAAGKHLFCEKPLGADLSAARDAVEAAEKSGVRHAVNLFFPEIPAWNQARQALPQLGQLQHAHLSWRLQSRAFRDGPAGWKTTLESGGGSLLNFASHSFHYLEWLFGPLASLVAWNGGGHPAGVQAAAHLLLRFESGMTANFDVAADAMLGSGHRLEVYGRQGSLLLANNSGDFARGFTLDLALSSKQSWQRLVEAQPGEGDGRIPPTSRIAARLLSGIAGGQEVRPGLREALRVQTLLQAATASLAHGQPVAVAA